MRCFFLFLISLRVHIKRPYCFPLIVKNCLLCCRVMLSRFIVKQRTQFLNIYIYIIFISYILKKKVQLFYKHNTIMNKFIQAIYMYMTS